MRTTIPKKNFIPVRLAILAYSFLTPPKHSASEILQKFKKFSRAIVFLDLEISTCIADYVPYSFFTRTDTKLENVLTYRNKNLW